MCATDLDESQYIQLPLLTLDEIRFAAYHAVDRRMHQMNGNRSRYGQVYQPVWDDEIESTCAELAFSKFRGTYWSGLTGANSADCGHEDVRWTRHTNGYLAVYPRQADERRIVLLDGLSPAYRIIGWAFVREAKQERYWCGASRGYYALPRRLLHPYVLPLTEVA